MLVKRRSWTVLVLVWELVSNQQQVKRHLFLRQWETGIYQI
jgi:hypothetical protein